MTRIYQYQILNCECIKKKKEMLILKYDFIHESMAKLCVYMFSQFW